MAEDKPKEKTPEKGRWSLYEGDKELKRKNKPCPKCGPGTFLGAHKDRLVCGLCQYAEMINAENKEANKAEEKEATS
tara:strand:+ start:409 stop:639 length:231 start_codon:yes stop_codon:yes gene_type:complete